MMAENICRVLNIVAAAVAVALISCSIFVLVEPSLSKHERKIRGVKNLKEDSSVNLQRAKKILEEVPLIDGHNDLPWNLQINFDGQLKRFDLNKDMRPQLWHPDTPSQTDIPRLTQGMVGAQFWSVYTRCNVQYKDAVQKAMELIDLVKRFTSDYSDFFQFVTNVEGIQEARNEGKLASLIGIEGGHMIGNSLSVLRMMYSLGVRYLTLTWNCNTPWADYSNPTGDSLTPMNNGLTEWGKILVGEMNRLGMMVDLSHVSYETMVDALEVSTAPVIFSHSSAYALCPHRRNVQDDVLYKLKDNGGIVMINFYTKFLNCTEANRYVPGPRNASLDQIVDHMEHVRNLIGVDHIGLGGDFDGIEYTPVDLDDTSMYPNLVNKMLERGWSDQDVKKVVGENFLRVFLQVETVRDSLLGQTPAEDRVEYRRIPDRSCMFYPNWTDPSFDEPIY